MPITDKKDDAMLKIKCRAHNLYENTLLAYYDRTSDYWHDYIEQNIQDLEKAIAEYRKAIEKEIAECRKAKAAES